MDCLLKGPSKYRTDLAKYRTPVRIRPAYSSQPCCLRHSTFLRAIACTFSSEQRQFK
jgi:hypothetical protein